MTGIGAGDCGSAGGAAGGTAGAAFAPAAAESGGVASSGITGRGAGGGVGSSGIGSDYNEWAMHVDKQALFILLPSSFILPFSLLVPKTSTDILPINGL
jgi:hypothetical protein